MSYDRYQYKIICEDRRHYQFVLHFLQIKKANIRKIKLFDEFPHPAGDAKKYVKETLDKAKIEYNKVQSRAKTMYIVIRDADIEKYESVIKAFNCSDYENIFLVIPKRNIETWLYFLTNSGLQDCTDEEKDRKDRIEYDLLECAKACFQIINKELPANAPESFRRTILSLKEQEQKGHSANK